MKLTHALALVAASGMAASGAIAAVLPKGTVVTLAFDQAFSSRTAHKGDSMRLHVVNDVSLGSQVVVRRGTRVTMTITDVKKNGRFGKNGQIKMSLAPIEVRGASIPLQPRQKGNMVGGSKGAKAGGLAGGGLLILGPIGLGAGYFVVGKSVDVKVGDKFETQVSEDVRVR